MTLTATKNTWTGRETFFMIWIGAGLLSLYPVARTLEASFPLFTAIWLAVPLIAVLLRRDAGRVGFRAVSWGQLLTYAALNLGLLLLVLLLFEPWSNAYGTLVREALTGDVTFGWLVALDGPAGYALMFLYSLLVTIFAEELFFRGWLLQLLLRHTRPWVAIVGQAALFTLVQALPALILTPLQAAVWIVAYAFLGVGLINGWTAYRTNSIWPGVLAAPLMNLIVTALVLA